MLAMGQAGHAELSSELHHWGNRHKRKAKTRWGITSGPAAAGSMALDSSLLHPQPPRAAPQQPPADP